MHTEETLVVNISAMHTDMASINCIIDGHIII